MMDATQRLVQRVGCRCRLPAVARETGSNFTAFGDDNVKSLRKEILRNRVNVTAVGSSSSFGNN